ncbi:MAG: tRNA (adenosine(37)-N6)-threonylcarbamoyltransferase complex ATPase subunit type 1 TsaE [Planctomycetaceae bacterium]
MGGHVFVSNSIESTIAFGSKLAEQLVSTDVLALSGDLGAGKTHLSKGIAAGLGVDPDIVNSPTFVLLQQYAGTIPVYHFDTYRLSDPAEFEDIGGIELLEGDGVCLIEWPERIEELLPARTVKLSITAIDIEQRQIVIKPTGGRAIEIISAIA